MCGIAGAIGCERARNCCLLTQEVLGRRGPDQRGMWYDDNATMIHTRLAVIDIEHGLQPMQLSAADDEYILVYNGELYNTPELRSELIALGHVFSERSDTEVLLHAYAEWKDKCVDRFNGIYAFAIWECKAKRLFIARDRIGVKPFFFAKRGKALIFGSELKALLSLGIEAEIDADGIAELVLIAPGRTPGCGVFKGVEELKPAHCGYYDLYTESLNINTYWALTDREHTENFCETVDHVRELVMDSISRQLSSDVPVCTFLSGGLDSSTISSVAALKIPNLHTFSVDYVDNDKYFTAGRFQPNSDSDYINKMNEYLGKEITNHRVVLKTSELVDALYEAVDARDLPGMADVDSSLLLFCKEIKKYATVALSGECADEY
jgi:asparagine synthase (glutamine-hydrolysing)